MSESGDLEAGVAALETTVGELKQTVQRTEQDAAAARVLAGGADRDVVEIRGEIREFRELNTLLHNATRADIVGIHTESSNLRSTMNSGFTEMRAKFDAVAAGQHQIVELITQVIDRND
ncbi:hypothetical protein [Antrihabitans spumae]|jgi:hypothetical protein|uniref:Uncharacterized protein n=1 Tax=Antrihabitans spumae TaxID=3373370 RepID=A0ABW7KIN7_9NOCA